MATLGDLILREFDKHKNVYVDRKAFVKNEDLWICCPYLDHSGGNEDLPSMAIDLTGHAIGMGRAHCFGCGRTVNWGDISKILKLSSLKNAVYEAGPVINASTRARLVGRQGDIKPKVGPPTMFTSWPSQQEWRGIKGSLLNKIGAVMAYDERIKDTRLALPVPTETGTEWIYALLERHSKKQKAYINTDGAWTSQELFLYDYAKKLMKKMKYRILLVGEGPRDALNPAQYGLPAVATLGAGTADNPEKVAKLLDLDPDLILIATDPDSAGKKASAKLFRALKGKVHMMKLKMKDGEDPGKFSEKAVWKIRHHAEAFLEKRNVELASRLSKS